MIKAELPYYSKITNHRLHNWAGTTLSELVVFHTAAEYLVAHYYHDSVISDCQTALVPVNSSNPECLQTK